MWKDLDQEQMAEEEHAYGTPRSPEVVEEIVLMAWWERHNRNLPCGANALRQRLQSFYHLRPLPSTRTIGRMLARHGLTRSRAKKHRPHWQGEKEITTWPT